MKFNLSLDISWNEKISSVLAILFVAVLSVLVAKITLDTADKVKNDFDQAQTVRMEKRAVELDEGSGVVNVPVNVPANANVSK